MQVFPSFPLSHVSFQPDRAKGHGLLFCPKSKQRPRSGMSGVTEGKITSLSNSFKTNLPSENSH